MNQDRKSNKAVERLVNKHAKLNARVDELEAHLTRSKAEEDELRRLKKEKLKTKDALSALTG